jgi:hypothetical protein
MNSINRLANSQQKLTAFTPDYTIPASWSEVIRDADLWADLHETIAPDSDFWFQQEHIR